VLCILGDLTLAGCVISDLACISAWCLQAEFTNSGSGGGRVGRNVGRNFLNSDGSYSEYTLR